MTILYPDDGIKYVEQEQAENRNPFRVGQVNRKGKQICGAKTKAGLPCMSTLLMTGKRCRVHGGSSPKGIAHYQFKTGRYSKYLPQDLYDLYQQARNDTELLVLRDEIALIDTRIQTLVAGLDHGSLSVWDELVKIYDEFIDARRNKDFERIVEKMNDIGTVIHRGAEDYKKWDEIISLIERRRKLVESERQRIIQMQQVITAEQAMLLMSNIIDIIRRNIKDKSVLSSISYEISKLAGVSGK